MTQFKAHAYFPTEQNDRTLIGGFDCYLYCDTAEEAKALAAEFPKFVKLKCYPDAHMPQCNVRIGFHADAANKGANETGAKRAVKLLEILGDRVEWTTPYGNSMTKEEFLTGIARIQEK